MGECTMFVGLDVHKESIEVALAPVGREEARSYGKVGGGLDAVDKLFRKLKSEHARLAVVYEAGPCGYGLRPSPKLWAVVRLSHHPIDAIAVPVKPLGKA